LHVDVVANTQLFEQHEALPTLDPGSWANRQGHLSPFVMGEDNRAFAQARSCPAPVDPDRRNSPPVLLEQGAALVVSYRWQHEGMISARTSTRIAGALIPFFLGSPSHDLSPLSLAVLLISSRQRLYWNLTNLPAFVFSLLVEHVAILRNCPLGQGDAEGRRVVF
jgi:hypothetical protein